MSCIKTIVFIGKHILCRLRCTQQTESKRSTTIKPLYISRLLIISVFLLFFLFPTGCSRNDREGNQKAAELFPQHIILIGIDTLRKDHLSCYGYPIQTTPAIDAFAREATLYERSISQSSWTLSSFASIFTSKYHHEHKSGMPCQQGADDKRRFNITVLDDSFSTLAEILQKQGYKTAAFTEGALMSPVFGVSQGFDLFKVCSVPDDKIEKVEAKHIYYKDIKNIVNTSLDWIRKNRQKSFFLFMHTYEPHAPLKDPLKVFEKTKKEYLQNGFLEQMRSCYLANPKKKYKKEDIYNWLCKERMLYDCEIKYSDHHIGRFFKELKKMGIYDKSLIVFTRDHGEEFGEHGELQHGKNLYQTSIAVPLIIKKPGQKKGRRENSFVAEGIDIMPTILEACRIDMKNLTLSGQSLSSKQATKIARSHLFTNKKKNFAAGFLEDQKTIYNYDAPAESKMFDLSQDPLEMQNMLPDQKSIQIIKQFIEPDHVPQTVDTLCFDEFSQEYQDIKEQLRTLGYIE
jgi:arylsulfatase A-like enzyme